MVLLDLLLLLTGEFFYFRVCVCDTSHKYRGASRGCVPSSLCFVVLGPPIRRTESCAPCCTRVRGTAPTCCFCAKTKPRGRLASQPRAHQQKSFFLRSVFPKKSFWMNFFFFRAKPSTSHDLLSNDDDGETSSASEDSTASYRAEATASYKRPAEPSAAFRLPPSQRSRTTTSPLQLPGWLPVSSGGTFETGTAGVADAFEGHPRQLPRLAALETLLSSHNQQPPQLRSPSSSSLQQHHRQDFPATEATVQLPSLLHASKSSASSVGSLSSSTSSSPTCSPGLRSCSPPYGGRHELPSPACTQGPAAARTSTSDGGSVNVNQRWLAGTGSTNADNRRRVPRINALSPTKNGTRPQPWHTTALEAAAAGAEVVAAAAGTTTSSCWPTHAREGRREMNAQTTAGPYSNASGALAGYAREVVEERSTTTWAKQHGASAAWPLQRHHLHQQQVRVVGFLLSSSLFPEIFVCAK